MKKNLFFFIFLFLSFSFLPAALIAENDNDELYAVITKIEGSVSFKPENTAKWLKTKIGLGLKKGDSIKTGDNSKVTILLEGGTIFRITQNSVLELEKLLINLSKNTSEIQVAMNKKGSLLSYVSKMKVTKMGIKTPVATVSVRGTGLSVDVLDENTASVAVFEGKVVVKDFVEEAGLPKDDNELMLAFLHEISVKPDQVTTITKKGINKPQKITSGELLAKKEEFKQLKAHSEETQKSWVKANYAQRKTERTKVRKEVIDKSE
ncbi:MAG: FecR family protein [Elusimicrobiota bacterium]